MRIGGVAGTDGVRTCEIGRPWDFRSSRGVGRGGLRAGSRMVPLHPASVMISGRRGHEAGRS